MTDYQHLQSIFCIDSVGTSLLEGKKYSCNNQISKYSLTLIGHGSIYFNPERFLSEQEFYHIEDEIFESLKPLRR